MEHATFAGIDVAKDHLDVAPVVVPLLITP